MVAEIVKVFHTFYGTLKFVTIFTRFHHCVLPEPIVLSIHPFFFKSKVKFSLYLTKYYAMKTTYPLPTQRGVKDKVI